MKLTSPAFSHNEVIPATYTCDGADVNPPLIISDIPTNTKSLVLIADDPDAPGGTWVHWTLWNMSPDTIKIAENSVPQGAVEGMTSFGKVGYGGPCPPHGVHRYFFKLYALDTLLSIDPTTTASTLETRIEPHILEKAELVGRYQRGS